MYSTAAVLAGDLIGSTQFKSEKVDEALDLVRAVALDHFETTFDLAPNFTRFRGDGWQFAISHWPSALRLAIQIMAGLKGSADLPQTRVSIGIGAITSLGTQTLADASGEAFISSGRGLDWLERNGRCLSIAGPGIGSFHQIAVELFEMRLNLWTKEQAEAAALYLRQTRTTGRDIAEKLKISPQAVSYRLKGADAQRLAELVYNWETEVKLTPENHHA